MFNQLKEAVENQFELMHPHGLYLADVSKEWLWDMYISSFPAGSNPMFIERTEHDCQSCKHFIRAVGNLVTIVNGQIMSIWDVQVGGIYQPVVDAMASLVKAAPIRNVYCHYEKNVGISENTVDTKDSARITWKHFSIKLPAKYIMQKDLIPTYLGNQQTKAGVFLRSLQEITRDGIDVALELIDQGSVYRGSEFRGLVAQFSDIKLQFDKAKNKELFVWSVFSNVSDAVAKIKNSAIGTLLLDLSSDRGVDQAVAAFETIMAPANYKRPTALVTKSMIQGAQGTIESLGFTSALGRRFAVADDLTINNVLFADHSVKAAVSVFDEMLAGVKVTPPQMNKVEEISIENFIANVLPKAQSIELLFENRHQGNLMSLVAPIDPTSKTMFKWKSNFSWSYDGEVADSIKERVKKAGGSVTGDLCCRLAWDYTDDLDFHMHEPAGGDHIYYGNRRRLSACGGMLDIDANGADGIQKDPVENIFYSNKNKMREGVYSLSVNNFSRRSHGVGFEVELEFGGQTLNIVHAGVLKDRDTITVARIEYSKKEGIKVIESLPSTQATKLVWGVNTQSFQKVKLLTLSPNYWDEKSVGNKHYFFILSDCKNPDRARGFFNEFLIEELTPHRKVFEILGSKMRTEPSDYQLSGLGFSSTQRNSILCRVSGALSRTVKINF